MKANTVRLLAGGLAATIMMTNVAVMPVFAGETPTEQATAIETVAETSYDMENTQETTEDTGAKEAQNSAAEETDAAVEAQNSTEEETDAAVEAQNSTEEEADAAKEDQNSTEDEAKAAKEDQNSTEEETEAAKEDQNSTEDEAKAAESATEEAGAEEVTVEEAADAAESTHSDDSQGTTARENDDAREIEIQEDNIVPRNIESRPDRIDLPNTPDPDETPKDIIPDWDVEVKPAEVSEIITLASPAQISLGVQDTEKLIEEEAEKIANSENPIGSLITALMELNNSKDTGNAKKTAKQDPNLPSPYLTLPKSFAKSVCTKAMDKIIEKIPLAEFIGDPIKGLICGVFGLNADEKAIEKVIFDRCNETNRKIDELKGETKRTIETVGSIRDYGNRLDAFTSSSTRLAQEIEKYRRDDSLTENEKAIRIAALLGNSSNWIPGNSTIFKEMDFAAQTMRSKSMNGPKADPSARNMFDLFYDYNKETSMFSGEAMNKADEAIKMRTSEYTANCQILFEALKAHDKVAKMTSKEVSKLDAETKAIYKRVKSSRKDIQVHMIDIIETFTGSKTSAVERNKTGILDAAKEYYNKDRLVLLEKSGETFKETALSPVLYTKFSEAYYDGDDITNHSGLTREQVLKLQQHANELGMPMLDYLESVGYDVSELRSSHRTPYLSTLNDRREGYLHYRSGKGSVDSYYYGIDMSKTGAQEVDKHFYYYHKGQPWYKALIFWEENIIRRYDADGLVVALQKR